MLIPKELVDIAHQSVGSTQSEDNLERIGQMETESLAIDTKEISLVIQGNANESQIIVGDNNKIINFNVQQLQKFSLDELWQDLYDLAKYRPKRLGVIPTQIDNAAMDDDGEERFLTQVVSRSPVWIEMKVELEGYLILLDRDATGEIVILAPSPFIPRAKFSIGRQRFPHINSTKRVFRPATLGDEVFLAIILSELPNFDWLLVGEKCLRLDAEQLLELFNYIKKAKPLELIRSQVQIISQISSF